MPGVFWSDRQIQSIRQRISSGDEPWTSAFAALIRNADAAMAQEKLNLRQNGGSPWFRQDAVYIPGQDGVRNPESNRKSSELARTVGNTCLNLALAYRFTGETHYAENALERIHAWCLDQATRMFPTGFVFDPATAGLAYGGDIVLMAAFPPMFLAIYLLQDYPKWHLPARAGVKRWVKSMVDAQRPLMFHNGQEMYNNWEDHRLEYLCTGALAIDDVDLLINVFDRWQLIIPMKMTQEGQLPRETERTRSMHYTLFALNSMTFVAEIGRQFGLDLYNVEINGRSLKKAVDYAAGHLLNMDGWPFQMIEPLNRPAPGTGAPADMGLFELAHAQWGEERYLDVINHYGGRPVAGLWSLMRGCS